MVQENQSWEWGGVLISRKQSYLCSLKCHEIGWRLLLSAGLHKAAESAFSTWCKKSLIFLMQLPDCISWSYPKDKKEEWWKAGLQMLTSTKHWVAWPRSHIWCAWLCSGKQDSTSGVSCILSGWQKLCFWAVSALSCSLGPGCWGNWKWTKEKKGRSLT